MHFIFESVILCGKQFIDTGKGYVPTFRGSIFEILANNITFFFSKFFLYPGIFLSCDLSYYRKYSVAWQILKTAALFVTIGSKQ